MLLLDLVQLILVASYEFTHRRLHQLYLSDFLSAMSLRLSEIANLIIVTCTCIRELWRSVSRNRACQTMSVCSEYCASAAIDDTFPDERL